MKHFCFFSLCLFSFQQLEAKLPDLIPYRKGNLWGYCDSTKKKIIEPQFEMAAFFSGATAMVEQGTKYGLIDRQGKPVTPFTFENIYYPAHGGNRLYTAGGGENNALMNEKGETLVQPINGYMAWISRIFFIACDCSGHHRDVAVYTADGKQLTTYSYKENDAYWNTSEKLAGEYGLAIIFKNNRAGVIDSTGRFILPFEFNSITLSMCGGSPVFSCQKGKAVEWYTLEGKATAAQTHCMTEKQFPQPVKTSADPQLFFKNAWKDSTGKIFQLPNQLEAQNFSNGYAVFMDKKCYCGIVDEHFQVVIPAKYAIIQWVDENGMSLVQIKMLTLQPGQQAEDNEGYIDIYGTEYWEN